MGWNQFCPLDIIFFLDLLEGQLQILIITQISRVEQARSEKCKKISKIMKKLSFLISLKIEIVTYSRGRGSSRNSKMMIRLPGAPKKWKKIENWRY